MCSGVLARPRGARGPTGPSLVAIGQATSSGAFGTTEAPEYARQLLRREGTTDGFQRLKEEGRLDLTMEAVVLNPEYAELFTDEERSVAVRRLAEAGYQPSKASGPS